MREQVTTKTRCFAPQVLENKRRRHKKGVKNLQIAVFREKRAEMSVTTTCYEPAEAARAFGGQ